MTDVISIQYDQMRQIGGQFNQQEQLVRQMTSALHQQMQVLRGGAWIADAATSFYDNMDDEVFTAFARLQQALNRAGDVCEEIVKLLEAAEDEAGGCLPND